MVLFFFVDPFFAPQGEKRIDRVKNPYSSLLEIFTQS